MITFIPGTFAFEVAGTGMSRWDEPAWSLYLKSITCLEILWRECLIYIKAPMQSNPTHPLGRNQSPSPEKKLGVQRKPQRTPYQQEESLQHLAVDHITGVNASRGPIQSRPTATPDQHPDAPPWATRKESHIKLPVAKNRLGQVHPHSVWRMEKLPEPLVKT
jgi:hypothetical protein